MSNLMSCTSPQYNDLSQSSCSLNNNYGYSSLGDIYNGFSVPIGSQLSLLSAVNASNKNMNLSRVDNNFARVALVQPGYNTLSGPAQQPVSSSVSYGSPFATARGNMNASSVNYFSFPDAYRQ